MFTANSMNCLTEALGLSLPGNGSTLATHADRKRLFVEAGHLVVDLAQRYYEQDDASALPRSIASKGAFENAMLLLGVVSCTAHLMITRALKLAPASTLAPLHYSLLLWAIVFGLVFFGDVPSPRILVGSAIVVLAGIFIFHRQKVVETVVPPENVPKGVN